MSAGTDDPSIAEDVETPIDASVDDPEGRRLRQIADDQARDARYFEQQAARENQARQQESRHIGETSARRSYRDPVAVIVVADSARAQIYVASRATAPIREVASLLNPDGRSHERERVSDAAGRRGHQPTQGAASALGGGSAKAHRGEEFAARVCECTTEVLDRYPDVRVHVMAEPGFLGLLRRRMELRMRNHVVSETPKSLVGRGTEDIRAALPPVL